MGLVEVLSGFAAGLAHSSRPQRAPLLSLQVWHMCSGQAEGQRAAGTLCASASRDTLMAAAHLGSLSVQDWGAMLALRPPLIQIRHVFGEQVENVVPIPQEVVSFP